tara:strand:+ start:110 stop:553 length:444 start_codon:yes stop_codon:yes gene_type:complete
MTPKKRANLSAKAMWDNDLASKWVGIELVEVDEGYAEMTLTVAEHHCNGHGIGHGGITFLLADSAFAFACNSRNQATVAMHNVISFLHPTKLGDQLTAKAREKMLSGKNGIYDVTVRNQKNQLISEMRGMSRTIKGNLFVEEGSEQK